MNRVVDAARLCLYAAVGCDVVRSPDIASTIALLAPAHEPATVPGGDGGAATIGWLASAVATVLGRTFGFAGLALGTALAVFVTLALVEWRARRIASPPVALAAAALAAVCSLDAAHIGAGSVNGLFLAALLLSLEASGTGGLIAILLVTSLWCNASPAGICAPMFALAYVFGTLADGGSRAKRVRSQTAALVCALATLATPAFLAFPVLAWRSIALDNMLGDMLPTAPYAVAPLGYGVGVILTIVLALAAGARGVRSGPTFAVAFAAYLAFSKGAFVPFLAIAGAPVLAQSAARMFAFARPANVGMRSAVTLPVTVAFVAILAAYGASKTLPVLSSVASQPPFGALAKFASLPEPRGRLLCTKLAWCDVASRRYGIDVVAGTRIGTASDDTIATQRDITRAKKNWGAEAVAAGIGAIFVDTHSGFATLLAADGWTPYATDGTGVLYVRGASR